jgi:hypothetical protein
MNDRKPLSGSGGVCGRAAEAGSRPDSTCQSASKGLGVVLRRSQSGKRCSRPDGTVFSAVRDERCLLGSSRITGTSSCGLVHQTLRNDRFAVSRIARFDPALCLMFLPGFPAVVTPAGDFAVTPGECLLCRFLRSYEFTKAFRPATGAKKSGAAQLKNGTHVASRLLLAGKPPRVGVTCPRRRAGISW